jgi:lysophospholipase L1-like esterase
MHRRTAAAFVATLVAGGCGGGGGGQQATAVSDTRPSPPPAPAPAPASAPAPLPSTASSDIALWGDSMVPGVARAFQYVDPARQIHDGGIPGETSMQIAARQLADTAHTNWINVFWYGHNNPTAAAQIKADIAASVAHLASGNTSFVVMSVVNQDPREVRGTPGYQILIALNNELAATYPQNYLDIRAFLVQQSNPGDWQEAQDLQEDVPASSLRFDAIHLNGHGSEMVARRIKEYLEAKGW